MPTDKFSSKQIGRVKKVSPQVRGQFSKGTKISRPSGFLNKTGSNRFEKLISICRNLIFLVVDVIEREKEGKIEISESLLFDGLF